MTRILQLRWLDETEWKRCPYPIADGGTDEEILIAARETLDAEHAKYNGGPDAEFRVVEVLDA